MEPETIGTLSTVVERARRLADTTDLAPDVDPRAQALFPPGQDLERRLPPLSGERPYASVDGQWRPRKLPTSRPARPSCRRNLQGEERPALSQTRQGFQRVRRQKLQLLWLRPAIRPGGKELKAQRKELKPKRKETKARHKEMKPKRKETKI